MNDKHLLDALFKYHLLDKKSYDELLDEVRPLDPSSFWSVRLLICGTGLILAGIICFFAANWQNLGTVLKLSLPLLGLLGSAVGVYKKGIETLPGQIFAFAVAAFIGVYLAVFGQIYQTGAFLYELCGMWALLLLPLALVARNKWLWLITYYIAVLYWLNRFMLTSSTSNAWPQYAGVFGFSCVMWLGLIWKKSSLGFQRFVWVPLTGYMWLMAANHAIDLFRRRSDWSYFSVCLVFSLLLLLRAKRTKDVFLFGWNLLAVAGLICVAFTHVGEFFVVQNLSCMGLVYLLAGFGTYSFWRYVQEDK